MLGLTGNANTRHRNSVQRYRFRSPLEARWAVFFDTLNIDWRYEAEGFEFPEKTRYLPDFWIPCPLYFDANSGYWFEINGLAPTLEELAKCENLAL